MSGEFGAALRHAMEYDSPDRRIDSLKTSVSNILRSGDPSIRVKKTEYFNHTFAPDLVLTWPDEKQERLVFLRTNPNPEWLAADLRIIAPSHPIMFTLDDSGLEHRVGAHENLVTAAKAAHALVTDPDAIEEFVSPHAPITSLLTNAVIRGGRGSSMNRRQEGPPSQHSQDCPLHRTWMRSRSGRHWSQQKTYWTTSRPIDLAVFIG